MHATSSDGGGLLTDARRAIGAWRRRLATFRAAESRLSVDIGTRCIKVIESRVRAGRLEIIGAIHFDTPAASVVNYAVVDPLAVAETLRRNLDRAGVRARLVTTCVPGPAAVLKRFKLPLADADRLDLMVRGEVQNLASFGSDPLYVDHQVNEAADEDVVEVIVVAARADTIRSYVRALEAADLQPQAVDVDYLALANMVDANHGTDPSRTIAFVHVGAGVCGLGIQSHGSWVFTGNVGIGMAAPAAPGLLVADGGDPALPADERTRAAEIVRAVDRALRFYWPDSAGDRVDEILLSGGGARVPALAALLAESVGCSVKCASPFRRAVVAADAGDDRAWLDAPLFAVAAGLAARSLEEP